MNTTRDGCLLDIVKSKASCPAPVLGWMRFVTSPYMLLFSKKKRCFDKEEKQGEPAPDFSASYSLLPSWISDGKAQSPRRRIGGLWDGNRKQKGDGNDDEGQQWILFCKGSTIDYQSDCGSLSSLPPFFSIVFSQQQPQWLRP
jgi:hypothetical protein